MKLLRPLLLLLITTMLLPACGTAKNAKYALWQKPAFLRGANRVTAEELDLLKLFGANLVQFSAQGIWKRQPPYEEDAEAIKLLDTMVQRASEQELYIVIAMRTGPGIEDVSEAGQHKDIRSTLWGNPDEIMKYGEMWAAIAKKYKDNPHVIGYNLLVEPIADRWAGDESGDPAQAEKLMAAKGVDWQRIASGWAKQIRAVDGQTPIIVGAQSWAAPQFFRILKPIDDPYAVYDIHQYEPHVYTHQLSQGAGAQSMSYPGPPFYYWRAKAELPFDKTFLATILKDVRAFQQANGNPPIFVGEYGVEVKYTPNGAQYIADQTALFTEYGWHSALWYDPWRFNMIDDAKLVEVMKTYWKQTSQAN